MAMQTPKITTSTLAILGGVPVRTRPFSVEPMVDGREEALVLEAIRRGNFPRYIAAFTPELDHDLRLTSAAAAAMDAQWHFLGGPAVRQFAAAFAVRMGVRFAIPINSATSGLSVALAAAGVGPGDEVILPAVSFTATASAPLMFNSIPVFVDVDGETFCIDPRKIEAAITPRTKAILVVHLTGNVADMDAIMEIARRHDLVVIEDTAQAIGAKWGDKAAGVIGNAGVFSFQQSKNIMTGEGGMIITDDVELARRARLIMNHAEVAFPDDSPAADLANIVGFNFRMPEVCAALGLAQLEKLERVNAWRTKNADLLRNGVAELPGIDLPICQRTEDAKATDVPHMFVALYDQETMGVSREIFVAAMRAEGIPVGVGYDKTLYGRASIMRRMAYGANHYPWENGDGNSDVVYREGMCPVAERLLDKQFLWFYHIAYSSTEADMDDVISAVKKVVDAREDLRAAAADIGANFTARSQGRVDVYKRAPAG